MDPIAPAHILAQRKQPHVVDDGLPAAAVLVGVAGAADDERRVIARPQSREE